MSGYVNELLDSRAFCASVERTLRDKIEWLASETDDKSVDEGYRHRRPLSCPAARSADSANLREYIDNAISPQILPSPINDMGTLNIRALNPPTIPISDWRFHEGAAKKYGESEIVLRNKLASLYRLADIFQWSQGIYNHITVRVSEGKDGKTPEILINPFGMLYQEITASSLVKVDLAGNILDSGSANMSVNQAGYVLHSAIHEARPDVRCLIHLHTPVVAAVSAMKCGVLPISQEAMVAGPVAYYHYKGIVSLENERREMAEALGDKNIMILHNHGFVACGQSVEDALHLTFNLILACQAQIRAVRSAGLENIIIPEAQAVARAYNLTRGAGGGGVIRPNDSAAERCAGHSAEHWGIGELEWEAWMRVLDSAGHHTGHIYKMPQLKNWHIKHATDDTVANSHSNSTGTREHLSKAQRLALLKAQQQRDWRWVAPAHGYQRVECFETGADNPRVFIKWIESESDESKERSRSVGGTPLRISAAHQFTPTGTDTKAEFRCRRQTLRLSSSQGAVSSGPLSQIMDRPSQERLMERSQTDCRIFIGTASKGIIDRNYQHNALVYRQMRTTNPFAGQTSADIDAYIALVNARHNDGLLVPLDAKVNELNEIPKSCSTPALESRLRESSLNDSQRGGLPKYGSVLYKKTFETKPNTSPEIRRKSLLCEGNLQDLDHGRDVAILPRVKTSSARKERGFFSFMHRRKA